MMETGCCACREYRQTQQPVTEPQLPENSNAAFLKYPLFSVIIIKNTQIA